MIDHINPFIAYLNHYTTVSSEHEAALVGNDGKQGNGKSERK